ncbi:MAG: hypothetical protein ACTSW7_01155 [Candidatus Thorarchaeota archaeon]|nr:hypothetical protein [Thermoplasmatales archaeon]
MKKEEKKAQPDNVVEMKDNGETDKRKEEEKGAVDLPHLNEEELQQFKLFDAEMTKRMLLVGNTTLAMKLEEAQHQNKVSQLMTMRNQQQEDSEQYQRKYEEFNKGLTGKYRIRPDVKISIDTETGVIRELP